MEKIRHKIVSKKRVGNIKCYLRKHYIGDPECPLYFTISTSDGLHKQHPTIDGAQAIFKQVIEFEQRQMLINF